MSGPKHLEFHENEAARARLEQTERTRRILQLRQQIADLALAANADTLQGTANLNLQPDFWMQQTALAEAEQDAAVLQRQLSTLQQKLQADREQTLQIRSEFARRQLNSDVSRKWAVATRQLQQKIADDLEVLQQTADLTLKAEFLNRVERQVADLQQQMELLQRQEERRGNVITALAAVFKELGARLDISEDARNRYLSNPAEVLELTAHYTDGGIEQISLPLSMENVVRNPDALTDSHQLLMQMQQRLQEQAGIEMNFKSIATEHPGPDPAKTAKPIPGSTNVHQRNSGLH